MSRYNISNLDEVNPPAVNWNKYEVAAFKTVLKRPSETSFVQFARKIVNTLLSDRDSKTKTITVNVINSTHGVSNVHVLYTRYLVLNW